MIERPPVAAVVVDLHQRADLTGVEQALGGDMGRIPGERPVDRQPPRRAVHCRDHPPRVGDAGGEGLLDHHVEPPRGQRLHVLGVFRRGGADDGQIGGTRVEAGVEIGEDPLGRDREGLDRRGHARGVGVPDADDLGVGMRGHLAQQVAHVHVVETDAQNPAHGPLPPLPVAMLAEAGASRQAARGAQDGFGTLRILSGSQVASSGKAISTKTITTMIRNIGIAARAM